MTDVRVRRSDGSGGALLAHSPACFPPQGVVRPGAPRRVKPRSSPRSHCRWFSSSSSEACSSSSCCRDDHGQYAVFRATRAGSLNQGDCTAMTHAAVAALLPTFSRTDSSSQLAAQFSTALGNGFKYSMTVSAATLCGSFASSPRPVRSPGREDLDFDRGAAPMRLETKMVFWYPMRIPFANWVITAMARAIFGIQSYTADNPLIPTQRDANWTGSSVLDPQVLGAYSARTGAGEYVFPIETSIPCA